MPTKDKALDTDYRHPFGVRGQAVAIIVPLYLRWAYDEAHYMGSRSSTITRIPLSTPKLEDVTRGRLSYKFDDGSVDIGDELPSSPPIPKDNNIHRALRRFKCNVSVVITGWTFRCEGTHNASYGPDDPGHLSERNRVWLHQVAIEPSEQGKFPWPAHYELALAQDIYR